MENTSNNFKQLVVWRGTIVGKDEIKKFENWLQEEGFRVKYATEFNTTKGSNDLLFYIHSDDISKFAIWRLERGMSWWEDYLDNGAKDIVPKEVLNKFSYLYQLGKVNLMRSHRPKTRECLNAFSCSFTNFKTNKL